MVTHSLSLSSCLRLAPWPPPFIASPPFVEPFLFGWLPRCPVLQPPSCRNSAWCLGLCLLLFPCSAFGVICNSPLPHVASLSFGWLSQIPAHQPLASRLSCLVGFHISQRLSLSLSLRITVFIVVAERVRRQRGASFDVAIFACARCKLGVSPAVALAARTRCQGVAPRRERVQVDDFCVPGTLLELGQKASCFASCDKINAKLTQIAVIIYSWDTFW